MPNRNASREKSVSRIASNYVYDATVLKLKFFIILLYNLNRDFSVIILDVSRNRNKF